MLPTSGYFRGIPCPDHQQNNCHRPYCHFHHGARKEQPSTSSCTSSVSKQDVDWREGITAEELSNASYSSAACEDEVPEESAGGASGVGQSDLLKQLVSEAVKKVLEENPGLASSTDTSLVMKSINTSALVAQATAAAVIPTATKKKRVYLRPPDTPSYNPTPIKELKKRKLSTEASFDYSTPDPKVVKYTPTPILTFAAATSDSQDKNTKESVDSEVTDFSSEESDADINKRNCDFDLLEEVLAEHSQNNKVKVKKKRVKALGKLKYNLSVLEKKVDKSVMISDAKNIPASKLTTCIQPNKTPPSEAAPAEESYFLPPSPVFTSSSSVVNEVLNSIVYAKSSTMPVESEIAETVVCYEKTVQNVNEPSDKKDSTDTVTCSTSTINTEKQPVSSEAKTKSTCFTATINTEKKPVSSEAKKKSKGHTHLPQVVHTLVAPKLSRPSVRSWTPQVRSASSETKKDEYPLDEILQMMDGGDDDPKTTELPVKSSSVHEQKESIKYKKKYKVDLDKEIESLTKPSSNKCSGGKNQDQTDSENIPKSTKGKTRTLSSDEPKAVDDIESKNGDTDDEKSESSNSRKEEGKSDACNSESDDEDDTHDEEGNTDSDQEKEKHKKSKKRHRSSSESDHSRHRKRRRKSRKRHHKHSRSKKRKKHRHSTSGSEDSQEDAAETDQNTDVSDESNEEDKASTEKPNKHKKHKKYKHRKKSKYKRKKNKNKGKKKSKSYSSSRSSSRSRSVNTSRRSSRSSSEDNSRRSRSKEISNNTGKDSSRDSSEESRSRSRSSSKEHKRRSRKRKSLSKERSKDSNEEGDSSSEERSGSSSKENAKNSSRESRKSISKERKESTNKEKKENLRKEKRESTSRERRESTIKGSRERNSKERRDSTSRDRRESLSKDRRDSHKEGSSKKATKEKSKNSSIEGPESHKGRSSSKDKDNSSGWDKKESRDRDKEGAKKKESRSRSISVSHHRREGEDKSQKHTDPPVSIPMPIDPSTIKQEKDVLVIDLSCVKIENVDKDESSQVSSLSEKSVPKKSVSETGTKQGSNIKSSLECKSKRESTSHRRKKSTDSISDKSSHGRLSTDSRYSDNEALNERSPSSPEPQPRRLSMFDEILASTVSKSKGLTEISMFDSAESSSGKLKSHKTNSSNVKSKRRSSGSVESRNSVSCENSGDVGDSGTVGRDKEPPSDTIQHSNSSSSGQSSKHSSSNKYSSSNKHSSSSKHSSKHSSSNKHSSSTSKHGSSSTSKHGNSSTSKHVSSSSSSNKHGSSSSKHDSSGNKHGGGGSSSSSKHSSNRSSSSHKQTSRSEGKHKSSEVAGHSTPKASGAATVTIGVSPSGRSTMDTGTSSGISDRDSFDYNRNDSPLPDLSELDEIPHDDWEQIINSSNTPESPSKENPDIEELDHEDPDVMEECMRMFDMFQPDPSHLDTQVSTRKQKCDGQTVEPELVAGKKRVARSSTGNLIPKKPTYLQKVKQTPMQKMMERFNELKEINAALEKRLKQPQEVQGESSPVSSSTSSASISPASSSTHITSPPGKKRRISHVPNVSSLLNAREKIKSLPPTSSRNLLSANIAKASGAIPRMATIAQTMIKGGKRVAHVPKTEVLTRPIVPAEFGSKVPQNIRQRYLNTLIDECLKFCGEREAFNIGVAEERVCYQRSSSRMVYLSLAVNAVKRLRSQQMVGDAAQELIENEPQLFESSSKKEPSPPPQPSSSNVSSTSKTYGKPHPVNPNHVKLSHYSVLSGGGQKGSWSIEKPKKNVLTMGRLKDEALYKHLSRYMLTEEQMGENGFPYPHPDEKGKATVKTIDRRKKISPSCTERYCDRCSLLYYVDKWGFPVTTTSCCYHWGRSYKRRTYVGFESRYSCCDGDLQSGGCCLATTHVSQNYNPKKLRGYVRTIPKDVQGNDAGVYALDCEMSYTTGGCELTRVTVINSEAGVVYEQFVKPENPIIDYNTRFSGITESDMEDVQTSLRDVQASLLARFSEKTILIGHSLESDLHALKIIHDTVVDTSVVFPHKMGPPAKRALRNLASEYLTRIIQNDVSGHDSAEDAITCMDLMHWKIKEDLKGFK